QPDLTLHSRSCTVQAYEPLRLPLSSTFRYRDANIGTMRFVDRLDEGDGVIVDADGQVRGLWSSFAYQAGRQLGQTYAGVPAEFIAEIVRLARQDGSLRSLEAELFHMPLSAARRIGLPQGWARRIEKLSPRDRRVLAAGRRGAPSPGAAGPQARQRLVALGGKPARAARSA